MAQQVKDLGVTTAVAQVHPDLGVFTCFEHGKKKKNVFFFFFFLPF